MDVSEMVAPPTSLPGPRSVKVPLHGLWSPGLALEEIAGYLGVFLTNKYIYILIYIYILLLLFIIIVIIIYIYIK
jgi:hypothetical protein